MSNRETEFLESPRHQRPPESVAYTVDTASYGGSPTSVAVALYRVSAAGAQTDVSGTELVGSPSVVGHIITTPRVGPLAANLVYLLQVTFTAGGSIWSPACYIHVKP